MAESALTQEQFLELLEQVTACALNLCDEQRIMPEERPTFRDLAFNLFTAVRADNCLVLQHVLAVAPRALLHEVHDGRGRTAIHLACLLGSTQAAKMLLAASPELLRLRDMDPARGGYPIHYAAWNGQAQAMDLLLERGATLDDVDLVGNTPLLYVP
jgi:ankyrin repeat protein